MSSAPFSLGATGSMLVQVMAARPGPSTWVLPASAAAPRWITGSHPGIAVRVSAHPIVVGLCQAFGGALVSTSANLAGHPAVTDREALDPALLERINALVPGRTGGLERPTPIRDALTGEALRD